MQFQNFQIIPFNLKHFFFFKYVVIYKKKCIKNTSNYVNNRIDLFNKN